MQCCGRLKLGLHVNLMAAKGADTPVKLSLEKLFLTHNRYQMVYGSEQNLPSINNDVCPVHVIASS